MCVQYNTTASVTSSSTSFTDGQAIKAYHKTLSMKLLISG